MGAIVETFKNNSQKFTRNTGAADDGAPSSALLQQFEEAVRASRDNYRVKDTQIKLNGNDAILKHNDTIVFTVVFHKFSVVIVKLDQKGLAKGGNCILKLSPSLTVQDLKRMIAIEMNVPHKEQVLSVKGHPLDDLGCTIKASGIADLADWNGNKVELTPGVVTLMQLSEDAQESKKKGDKIVRVVNAVLAAQNPNYHDPAFQKCVQMLKNENIRKYVAPICGGEWNEWSAVGQCQVCAKQVDHKDKGLHCSYGGHRICWACMATSIDWTELTRNGDAEHLVLDEIGLTEVNAHLDK